MAHLSKAGAYAIFSGVLIAYTIQCELAAYLNRVGYAKPLFLLYLTHSSYVILGPIHYLGFKLINQPLRPMLLEVQQVMKSQLSVSSNAPFPLQRALQRLLILSVIIALPAGVWYVAIPMTQMTSLTALYNLNAFWAYILSIYYSKSERWQLRSAMAVGIACLGVLVMTYGDSTSEQESLEGTEGNTGEGGQAGTLLGDLLGLISGVLVGLYEVWYKRYIALPAHPVEIPMTRKRASYSRLLAGEEVDGTQDGLHINGYSSTADIEGGEAALHKEEDEEIGDEHNDLDAELEEIESEMTGGKGANSSIHGTLLFMTHANLITFMIGITTLLIFWIPLPFLHWFGFETFGLPRDFSEYAAVVGVCFGGVIFNAGFMILLAHWGPVVTSVGNLFTLILVAVSDEVIAVLNGYNALSFFTLIGSGFILASFGMLMTAPNEHDAPAAKSETHRGADRRTSSASATTAS